MKKNSLEERILFRLIKVIYILSLLTGFLFVGVMGWSEKPKKYIDNNKSILSCVKKGNSGSLASFDIYLYEKEPGTYIFEGLDAEDDIKARMACGYGEEIKDLKAKIKLARDMNISEEMILQKLGEGVVAGRYELQKGKPSEIGNILPSKNNSNYEIDYVYSVDGSWLNVLLWYTVGLLMVYIVLNLIRETLNYVLFGGSFQWKRVIKVS